MRTPKTALAAIVASALTFTGAAAPSTAAPASPPSKSSPDRTAAPRSTIRTDSTLKASNVEFLTRIASQGNSDIFTQVESELPPELATQIRKAFADFAAQQVAHNIAKSGNRMNGETYHYPDAPINVRTQR